MKKISVKIVNETGHTTLELTPNEALDTIRTETQEKGKWAYIDGNFTSYDNLTEQEIAKANDITIVNALLGGE